VATPLSSLRLRPVAGSHPAARRYLLARRNALPREDHVIAIAGLWAHRQALAHDAVFESLLWCPGDAADEAVTEVVVALLGAADASYEISERTLSRLHPGASAPGLLSVVRIPTWQPAKVLDRARLVLVADGIEYAGNLGALLRTVDASGADALIVTNPVGRLTHPTVFSASRGTLLTTPSLVFESVATARRHLERAKFDIVVADPDAAIDFRQVEYVARRTAIVVGSEGAGVSAGWRTGDVRQVSIAMQGRADSLNVATAAAVLLFGVRR
jgi:TrmH family RNA methyltransferase